MVLKTMRREPELTKTLVSVASISTGAFIGGRVAAHFNLTGWKRYPVLLAGSLSGAVIAHYSKKGL